MNKHTKLRRATKLDSEKGTNNLNLNKLPISIAIATVLTGGASSELYAQEQNQAAVEEQAIEEQIVTGIRSSLRKSQDRKRNSQGVVDSINAIDIGAFPDTNLAESLQRIPGVSIDRQRGEGSRITVRGWGPDFNLVLFNGRQMPTQSGNGRSFDFGNIASEGISAVDVIKTGDATLPTGGVGATINVITTKPLDNTGFHASGGVKFVNDTSTDTGDSLTPELSGVYSNTFLEDKLGVSLSASFQRRHTGVNNATVSGFKSYEHDDTQLPTNDRQINRPDSGIYSLILSGSTGYEIAEFERDRTNAQLTVQYQVNDDIRATVDYTYAEQDVKRKYSNLSAWYSGTDPSSTWEKFGEGNNAIWSPTVYSETYATPTDFSMGFGLDATINENKSLGFNLEWAVNERLNLELDYHNSSAEFRPNHYLGGRSLLSTSTFNRIQARTHFVGVNGQALEMPVLQLGLSTPLTKDSVRISGSIFGNDWNLMKIQQTALSGDFIINDNSKVDFGIQLTSADNSARSAQIQRDTWSGVGEFGDISDLLQEASIAGKFDQLAGGDDPRLQTNYYIANADELIARAEELIVKYDNTSTINVNEGLEQFTPGDKGPCGTGFCPSTDYTSSADAVEDTTSIYVQYSLEGDIHLAGFIFPFNFQAGLRREETKVQSPATFTDYNHPDARVEWIAATEVILVPAKDSNSKTISIDDFQEGTYDFLLPNINFKVDLTDKLVGRFSISETIARPGYNSLLGGINVGTRADINGGGSAGNPGLLPYKSFNIDGSLEYYFGEDSYVALGVFNKKVSNFIGSGTREDIVLFPNLKHPNNGENSYYAQAVAALNGSRDRDAIRKYILENFDGQPGVDAASGNGVITGIASNDPVLFDVTSDVNLDRDAYTRGIELSVQYSILDTGFGVIANTTIIDSDVEYDLNSLDEQFVITGLSDSYNIIGYYDKNGIQARLAYNWRDDFITGAGSYPVFVKDYGQWDMSASYEVIPDLVVYVEGLNLTNSTNISYGRTEQEVVGASQTGPRYHLGVRYKF